MGARIGELIEHWSVRFADAGLVYAQGTDNAWDEATWLVLSVCDAPDATASLAIEPSAEQLGQIESLGQRRITTREPLAYLLGEAYFAGLRFIARPGVIVPRSPLAQMINDHFTPWLAQEPRQVLDLCCGSGCIGIASAYAYPHAQVTLVDVDPAALALARDNVALHGLQDRIDVLASDLFTQVRGSFDLILCNPPYVDAPDMRALPKELQAEPALALAGGEDGLDLVRRLLRDVPGFLTFNGLLVLEVGNSAAALQRNLPGVTLVWPDLVAGGEGVCVLDAAACQLAAQALG